MSENREKERFRMEFQTLLWLFYLLAVGIGMLFEYQKYSCFGINIFDYADAFHFLLAPLADPKILLFSLLALLISWVLICLDTVAARRFPRLHRIISPSLGMEQRLGKTFYRLLVSGLTLIAFLFASSLFMKEWALRQILNQKPVCIRFHDNEVKTGIRIGKTRDTLFLKSGTQITAIPLGALVKEYDAR